MPKAPINYRESFFSVVKASPRDYLGNLQYRLLEWNAVETELGTMIEARSMLPFGGDTNKVVNVDVSENASAKFTLINEELFQNQYGTGGASLADFNI